MKAPCGHDIDGDDRISPGVTIATTFAVLLLLGGIIFGVFYMRFRADEREHELRMKCGAVTP